MQRQTTSFSWSRSRKLAERHQERLGQAAICASPKRDFEILFAWGHQDDMIEEDELGYYRERLETHLDHHFDEEECDDGGVGTCCGGTALARFYGIFLSR